MSSIIAAVAADLISPEPNDAVARDLACFAPLTGSWDLTWSYRRANGARVEGSGYAHFGWGLRGSAFVDIWGFSDGVVGTTIRFYDSAIDAIRSTWICPARNVLIPFIGRATENGGIVLNAVRPEAAGRRLRWSFVSIESTRFAWQSHISDDDGSSWTRNQEIDGVRRTP